jgi:transposase-like protein
VADHDRCLGANNKVEKSHQPNRQRDRKPQRLKSPGSAQGVLSIHSATYNTLYRQRHWDIGVSATVRPFGSQSIVQEQIT